MGFSWSYPQPLDPNQPSLIGDKLRNVIGSFAIYIRELQDVINILRENIGKTSVTWGLNNYLYAQKGDTLLYNHFLIIQQELDTLIIDYGFSSEVDILGRNWSDYSELRDNNYYIKWQIIQDFRDVCDALVRERMERWLHFETEIPIKSYAYGISGETQVVWQLNMIGDLGQWTGSPEVYPESPIYYLKESPRYDIYGNLFGIARSNVDWEINGINSKFIYQAQAGAGVQYYRITCPYGHDEARAYSWCDGIALYRNLEQGLALREDDYVKIQAELSGTYCYAFATWPYIQKSYSYPEICFGFHFRIRNSELKFLSIYIYYDGDPNATYGEITCHTSTPTHLIIRIRENFTNKNKTYDVYKYIKRIVDTGSSGILQECELFGIYIGIQRMSATVGYTGSCYAENARVEAIPGSYNIKIDKVGLVRHF